MQLKFKNSRFTQHETILETKMEFNSFSAFQSIFHKFFIEILFTESAMISAIGIMSAFSCNVKLAVTHVYITGISEDVTIHCITLKYDLEKCSVMVSKKAG